MKEGEMSNFAWTVIKGVRVLPIESDPRACARGSLRCHFFAHSGLCSGIGKSHKGVPCRHFSHSAMFISEGQMPAYLAQRLVEGT